MSHKVITKALRVCFRTIKLPFLYNYDAFCKRPKYICPAFNRQMLKHNPDKSSHPTFPFH